MSESRKSSSESRRSIYIPKTTSSESRNINSESRHIPFSRGVTQHSIQSNPKPNYNNLDDIKALRTSSNSYQFQTVIKLVGEKYKYNMKLPVTEEHFNIYRNTFASFGLGSSTGIDLENESTGIKGKTIAADLLLNYSIGQYDTYTPMQLTNYINTIATNGNRYALHYLKEIKSNEETIYKYEPILLNKVESNFKRINKGFQEVLLGTGYGYTNLKYKPAGKTGTSQVIYNKDITTINQSYVMYAPYDNPEYSIVVITPNVSYEEAKTHLESFGTTEKKSSKTVKKSVANFKQREYDKKDLDALFDNLDNIEI